MSLEGVADYEIRKLHGAVAWVYTGYTIDDAALARRFQPVFVSEPSLEDTIFILRRLKEKYEVHHGVRITDGAIGSAATLSNCYITDRFMRYKAIDLIEESESRLHMEVDSKPGAIDELDWGIIGCKSSARRYARKPTRRPGTGWKSSRRILPNWRRRKPIIPPSGNRKGQDRGRAQDQGRTRTRSARE